MNFCTYLPLYLTGTNTRGFLYLSTIPYHTYMDLYTYIPFHLIGTNTYKGAVRLHCSFFRNETPDECLVVPCHNGGINIPTPTNPTNNQQPTFHWESN